MKNVTEYNAPPAADHFREVTSKELAAIIHELHLCDSDDIGEATRAAELQDAFLHRVFVARDDDGYYFATEETEPSNVGM